MPPVRKTALVAGVLYLVTHVTSVTARLLYDPILNDPDDIIGSGSGPRVLVGALLEAILAMAIIGTAVALYPVVRRQNESFALGYAGLRILEASIIAVGIVTLLGIVTMRQDVATNADANPETLVTVGQALVAVNEWTFLIGPSFVLSVSTVLMAYLMYRSGLVPRFIGVLGLVGGPLVMVQGPLVLFGVFDQVSVWGAITALIVFAWEISLALWLVIKGFRPAALTQLGID